MQMADQLSPIATQCGKAAQLPKKELAFRFFLIRWALARPRDESEMKTLLLALTAAVVLPATAHAGSIACQADPRDVSANLSWDKDQATLVVTSPMGYEALPQLEGPVSASMQGFLRMQTQDLQGLGDQFKIQWTRNRCALSEDDPWVLSCGPGELVGESGIRAIGISGAIETERRASGKYERWKLRLTMAKGNTYFVTLALPKEFCRKSN